MTISTNPQQIQELLTRGVENIYPSREFLEQLLHSGKQLKLYVGYDATAPTFHIGHSVTLLKLRQFQDLGHKIIMLIGDFTAMIGDPTDKSAARQKLTRAQTLENCKLYQKQASAIINFSGDNPAELLFNSEWLSKLSFEDVLELSSHFTVQRLLERDMFQTRLEEQKPIYLHEFMYPLMQGYDSAAMDVDGEVGGNDQTYNMLAGRSLIKDLKGKEKFVMPMKLLVDASGKKMGKTEGNMAALTETAEGMYGKVMSWADGLIIPGFELLTRVPMDQVAIIEKELKKGTNPRDFKMKLAREIVKMYHGEEYAAKAEEYFVQTFTKKETPDEMPEIKPSAYDILTILIESKMCSSKSEARRVIEQGGVKVGHKKCSSISDAVKPGDIVQKGSRWFVRVV